MPLFLCFFAVAGMRSWFLALVVVAAWCGTAVAQEDKKTDADKPADPDTGESTIEEKTLGLLPNPLQKFGIKFAATYIGDTLGNVSGGIKRGAVYEGRLNLAVDVDLQKLVGAEQLTSPTCSRSMAAGFREAPCRTCSSSAASKPCPRRDCTKRILRNSGGKLVSLKLGQLAADSEFFN